MLLMSLGNADTEAPQSVQPLETIRALEAAALGRDRVGFTTLIESALSLTPAQAERFVHDQSGEPLLVAAKALAMPPVVLQRVLMFIDPAIGESVARVFDLAAFYERMSADAAHKIIDSVRGREPVRARKPRSIVRCTTTTRRDARAAATATRRVGASETQAPARVEPGRDSAHDVIEEGPPGAVLGLDDPQIRVEADLPRQIGFDVGFRLVGERKVEHALAGVRLVERRLRCRTVKVRLPSSRLTLMKIAPASSAPRRRSTAATPSTWQRRR